MIAIVPVFMFMTIAGVVVAIIVIASQYQNKTKEAWAEAASRLGFRYAPGSWTSSASICGLRNGISVTVDTVSRGSGNSRTTYTRYRARYPKRLGLGLKLTREGFFSGVGKFFGSQDIEVGDTMFDQDVMVKGASATRVREFLTPARRRRIHRFLTSYKGGVIDDEEVRWERAGMERDPFTIVGTVSALVELALSVTREREEDASLTRAMAAQDEGDADEAYSILSESILRRRPAMPGPVPIAVKKVERYPEPVPADPAPAEPALSETPVCESTTPEPESESSSAAEERLLQGELLYMAGRRDEARQAFEDVRRDTPGDPEAEAWLERIGGEHPAPASEPVAAGPDAASVCEELFAEGKLSSEVSRLFEERYAGCTVEWSGTLQKSSRYSYDFVLGDGPGIKAVVEIHQMSAGLYGDRKISAVVQLPEGAEADLQGRVGDVVCFRGKLLKVDGLMRNLYVSEGTLI